MVILQNDNFLGGELQITGETVGEERPVDNMHQRKAEMARHSDCFIALPGPIHPFFPFPIQKHNPTFLFYISFHSPLSKKTHDSGFHFPFTALISRWVWNYGRTVRSHHLGSTRHPRKTSKLYKNCLIKLCKKAVFWSPNL